MPPSPCIHDRVVHLGEYIEVDRSRLQQRRSMDTIGSPSSMNKSALIGLSYNRTSSNQQPHGRPMDQEMPASLAQYICIRWPGCMRQQRSGLTKLARGDNGDLALTNIHGFSLPQGLPWHIKISIGREAKISEAHEEVGIDGDMPTPS
jgi:hypothetical protein